jgi:hypothetical protein
MLPYRGRKGEPEPKREKSSTMMIPTENICHPPQPSNVERQSSLSDAHASATPLASHGRELCPRPAQRASESERCLPTSHGTPPLLLLTLSKRHRSSEPRASRRGHGGGQPIARASEQPPLPLPTHSNARARSAEPGGSRGHCWDTPVPNRSRSRRPLPS